MNINKRSLDIFSKIKQRNSYFETQSDEAVYTSTHQLKRIKERKRDINQQCKREFRGNKVHC